MSVQRESSVALGQGFRLGFLGALHAEVFRQRLEDEYQSEVLITKSFVSLKLVHRDGSETRIDNPADFPEAGEMMKRKITHVLEPMIRATIIAPDEYTGPIMELCAEHRGEQLSFTYFEQSAESSAPPRVNLTYQLPLSSIIGTFHSSLKSMTSGYASFDYEEADWQPSDMVRMNILVNGRPVDALTSVLHRSEVEKEARRWTANLKEVIPRQQFEIIIQAVIGSKIISRDRWVQFQVPGDG